MTYQHSIGRANFGKALEAFDGWIEAGETWTYSSADSPSFVFTIAADVTTKYSLGMKIRISQATGGTKYFFITKLSVSAGTTTVTIYGGTDYTLNNETISSPCWSMMKVPFGFPLDPAKWTASTTSTSNLNQATPAANTWYNIGTLSLDVPIGSWNVGYQAYLYVTKTLAGALESAITLSTANNTESDTELGERFYHIATLTDMAHYVAKTPGVTVPLNLTTKTTYYLNENVVGTASAATLQILGAQVKTKILAICAYL